METAELVEVLAGMAVHLDGAAIWHAIQRHEGTG